MSTKTKTLAKSLHTVTVLHRVASHLVNIGETSDLRRAIDMAATLLGYTGADDPYALCHAALLQLEKGIADTQHVARLMPTEAQLRAEHEEREHREALRADRAIDTQHV